MKKKFIYFIIALAVIATVSLTLIKNKKKLDKANTPVDRSHIPITVLTTQVQLEPMTLSNTFPATIQPYDEAKIFSEASGMISSLNIQLGQHVSKGQIIGALDQRILQVNLKQAEITAKSAEINRTKLKNDYLRAKDLYQNKAGLEIDMLTAKNNYENAENSYQNTLNQINLVKEQIRNAKIIAPLSGIISSHIIKNGEFVNLGTAIANITDISRLKTTVFVDQATNYLLKIGSSAEISSPVFGQEKLNGQIIYISPVADTNHNFQVDLLVENKDRIALKGGTDVLVSFIMVRKTETLTIPKSALMTDNQEPYVYTIENGVAKAKTIATGNLSGDKVEVLSGLESNQEIIYSGQINLHDGSKVKIIKNTGK